jgi:hypothetical protein
MGRFGIGARVRDKDGDEGVIVGKRNGEREVEYEGDWFGGGMRLWSPKAELTAVRPKLEIGKTYVDRTGDVRGPLKVNTRPTAESYPFTDGQRTWQADGTFEHGEIDNWDLVAVVETEPATAGYKVGDRVAVDYRFGSDLDGTFIGTIQVLGEDGSTDVTFDDGWTDGHDGDANDGSNNHWFFDLTDLQPFRLEAGKTYRTRDGRKVGPMEASAYSAGDKYPWTHGGSLWTANGVNYDGVDDLRTIVGLWTEPAVEAVAGQKFKVGDKVDLMRDGEPVERWSNMTITSMENNSTLYPIMTDGGLQVHEDELRLSPAKKWKPKFKVGDVVNYTLSDEAWQGTVITEVPEYEGGTYHGKHRSHGLGGFFEDQIVAAPTTPLPAVGTKVTLTAIVTGHNPVDRRNVNVVVDGLPPGRNSIGISPAALSIAA